MAQLDKFIAAMFARKGSEIRMIGNSDPIMIVAGQATQLGPKRPTAGQVQFLVSEIATDETRTELERSGASDFIYTAPGLASVEVSIRDWKGRVECTLRPSDGRRDMPSMLELDGQDMLSKPTAPERAGGWNGMGGSATLPSAPAVRPAESDPPSKPSMPAVLGFGSRLEAPRAPAQPRDLMALDAAPFATPAPTEQPVRPPPASSKSSLDMNTLFRLLIELGGSDLHLSSDEIPMIRKDGELMRLDRYGRINAEQMRALVWPIIPERNRKQFAEDNDTDFAYALSGEARFRANLFMDRKGIGGVFRIIPSKILTAEQLGLSQAIIDMCNLSKGLVLVTGPTGSGKSTTLCAMVDLINRTRSGHIITIEDPIEFVHENKKCLVNQREVNVHTHSFKRALRAALREDPDIVLVGEMRDLETIAIAIETAETGHLVFGTLHTTTAYSTIDRIIDQYPPDQQEQIRVMLSESLKGVVSQTLCKKIGGGRAAALEILLVTKAVSNLIREGKTFQIPSIMQTARNSGMRLMNDALLDLVKKGLVEPDEALAKAVDKDSFRIALKSGAQAT